MAWDCGRRFRVFPTLQKYKAAIGEMVKPHRNYCNPYLDTVGSVAAYDSTLLYLTW